MAGFGANAQKVISHGAAVTGDGGPLGALTDGLTTRNHVFNLAYMRLDTDRIWYGSPGAKFVVDLGSIKKVDAFRIWGDLSYGAGYVINQFSIESSSNGYQFTPIVTKYSAPLLGWTPVVIDFSGTVQARYIRFTVNNIADPNFPPSGCLTEFEVLSDELAVPEITRQPVSFIGPPGSTVTLDAPAESRQISRWQWQQDGAAVAGATQSTITVTNTPGIGTGNYRVLVSNSAGSGVSSNAAVGAFWVQSTAGQGSLEVEWAPGITFGIETNSAPWGPWNFWTNVTLVSSHASVPMPTGGSAMYFRVAPPFVPPTDPKDRPE